MSEERFFIVDNLEHQLILVRLEGHVAERITPRVSTWARMDNLYDWVIHEGPSEEITREQAEEIAEKWGAKLPASAGA